MTPETMLSVIFRVLLALLLLLPVATTGISAVGTATANDEAREYFTDLPLLTQKGEQVHFYSDILADRVVVISGFYTACRTVSPMQNLVLSRLQNLLGESLGKEVAIVSITIDPKQDTPEKVSQYSRAFTKRPGWIFLTGKPENVDWVNYKLGQYTEDPESHQGVYLLGNLKTGWWMKASPQAKAEDLHKRVEELLEDRQKR